VATAPSAVGSYNVVVSLSDPNYNALPAIGTLTIQPIAATVILGNLTQTYDGIAKPATATATRTDTGAAILASDVSITYDGQLLPPTDAGSYNVVAFVTNPDYSNTPVSGVLAINKAGATITLTSADLTRTYDGVAKAVRFTTSPTGVSAHVSVTYDGLAAAPTAAGSYNVVAALSDPNYSSAEAKGVLVINTPLSVAPTASPNTGTVPLAVTLSANAADSNHDTLTYSWNFGDGSAVSTAQNPVHTFAATGTFDVSVTVDDGKGNTATGTTTVTVSAVGSTLPGGTDADGDGFSNEIETALGSDPNSAASTPEKLATPTKTMSLSAPKMSIKLNFLKASSDSIAMSSVLLINDGFKPAGQTVIVDIGGVVKSFSLAGKGSVKNGGDSFGMSVKLGKDGTAPLQVAKFSVKLTKGNFGTPLGNCGLKTAGGTPTVPVTVIFDGQLYQRAVKMTYKATSKSGSAK
jgi:PKD repeat protein